jgi:hypothetical protein
MLNVIMLAAILQSMVFSYCYAECHYAGCHFAECGIFLLLSYLLLLSYCYADCHYADCGILFWLL